MTSDEQLEQWVAGYPVHNDERDECCPDFSCCEPSLLVDYETRKAFLEAGEELRMSMLGLFLGKAISSMNMLDKVHLVGFDQPDKCNGKGATQ